MEDYRHMKEMRSDLESIEVGDFGGEVFILPGFVIPVLNTSHPQAHWAQEWHKRLESLAEDMEETTLANDTIV